MFAERSGKEKAYLALVWVSIFWGTTWLASRIAIKNMPPFELVALRQFLGGAIFILYFIFKKHPFPEGKQWGTIFILSFLNFVISNGFAIWAMKYINSGLGAIIGAIFPLWLVIIAMFKSERLPVKALIGMLLGFSGICIIFYEHLKDFLNADFRFGILLSLTASVTWAFGTLYIKKKADSFNPYFSLGFQMIISSIGFFAATCITGSFMPITKIPSESWWCIAYLVVIGSTATFVAYIYALKNLPTSLLSVYAYINPIVAVLLGAWWLNEPLTLFIAMGGLVTLAGVFLVNNSFRKKIL